MTITQALNGDTGWMTNPNTGFVTDMPAETKGQLGAPANEHEALVQMQLANAREPRNMISAGIQKWTDIKVPALAIYADHHSAESKIPEAQAFEKGVPSSKVLILRNADHAVFLSNEDDVLREMKAFIAGLP